MNEKRESKVWSPQHRSLTVVALSMLSLSNALLLTGFIVTRGISQSDVLQEVRLGRSEQKIAADATNAAVALNRAELNRLREQMRIRTEQLRRANDAILKLDPSFKIEIPDPYISE